MQLAAGGQESSFSNMRRSDLNQYGIPVLKLYNSAIDSVKGGDVGFVGLG